jgi:hypothetical protein
LRDGGDIGFFGEKVTQAAVEVLIGAFLPGAVGVAKLDLEAENGITFPPRLYSGGTASLFFP